MADSIKINKLEIENVKRIKAGISFFFIAFTLFGLI